MSSWNRQIYPPKDGLFEVPQESPEYWDVFENMLKKPPNRQYAKTDPNTGQSSDVHGKKQSAARFLLSILKRLTRQVSAFNAKIQNQISFVRDRDA
jgi:hypothetical protein